MMPDNRLYVNGVNGATGNYLVNALTPAEIIDIARQSASVAGQTGRPGALAGSEDDQPGRHAQLVDLAD
jgi:hypothetical protein